MVQFSLKEMQNTPNMILKRFIIAEYKKNTRIEIFFFYLCPNKLFTILFLVFWKSATKKKNCIFLHF